MDSFREQWGGIIGIVFLITAALSVQEICVKYYKQHKEKIYMKKFEEKQPTILKELSLQEMFIIALIEESPNKTISLPINDGIIKRLESKFIIARTANTVFSDFIEPKFPYTLNPWVSETLNSNSDIIEFYENQLKENEIVLKEYFECLSAQGVFN